MAIKPGLFSNGPLSFAPMDEMSKRKAALDATQAGVTADNSLMQGADMAKWQLATPATEANMATGLSDTMNTATPAAASASAIPAAAALAAPLVSGALDPTQTGLGPSISSGATGASIGSMVAPGIGTAVGAAIGAGLGLFQAHNNASELEHKKAVAALGEEAKGYQKVAEGLRNNISFKFGTQRGTFSSRNKGFG